MEKQQDNHDSHHKHRDPVVINQDFVYRMMNSFAERNFFELNPHQPTLSREINGLLENYEKYGYPYCPCRLRDLKEDLFIDKRISCPCVYHKKEINENGFCKCELFISPLEEKPRLISTTIHRLKIKQSLNEDKLEILFEREGKCEGEVKVFIPKDYNLGKITVETDGSYQIEEKIFNDRILYFYFTFFDKAKIFITVN